MFRLGAVFVAVCIALIAASTGVASYFYFSLPPVAAAVLAIAILIALSLCDTVLSGAPDGAPATQIAQLSRGTTDLARQVADIGRRVAALEVKVAAPSNRSAVDPIVAELGELGTLFKQLAETVAAHDALINDAGTKLSHAGEATAPAKAPLVELGTLDLRPPSIASPLPLAAAAPSRQQEGPAPIGGMVERIRDAVESGRIDLYLQSIVALPQRKLRYYEMLSRLRLDTGDVLTAAEFVAHAEAAGLMGKIDTMALVRAGQVVRRLRMKNSDVGLFCNLAGATLADPEFFPQLIELAEANKDLAAGLIFELSQHTVRALGPIEQEGLAALTERGFRLSMDQASDLRFDPRGLAERGFRFVKVPAALLLDHTAGAAADIHPADLADLLGRYGIELIATHIETEASVVDLLDFDVRYGQGLLFSAPRPVRQEALRPAPARREGVAPAEALGNDKRPARPTAPAGARSEDGSVRQGGLARLARSAVRPA